MCMCVCWTCACMYCKCVYAGNPSDEVTTQLWYGALTHFFLSLDAVGPLECTLFLFLARNFFSCSARSRYCAHFPRMLSFERSPWASSCMCVCMWWGWGRTHMESSTIAHLQCATCSHISVHAGSSRWRVRITARPLRTSDHYPPLWPS